MNHWHTVFRQMNLPVEFLHEIEDLSLLWATEKLERKAVEVRRAVCFGACLAARTALQELRVQEAAGSEPPPLMQVAGETAARAFDAARGTDGGFAELQSLFRPIAILHDEALRGNRCGYLFLDDTAAPTGVVKALTAVAIVRAARLRVLGEMHLLPPAHPREGRARRRWIRALGVQPPSRREPGGPYWRLGKHNLWRLNVLPWNERLALAALVGTTLRQAILLAPPRLVPKVGTLIETAREMGRTFIAVPLEACPAPWRGSLHALGGRPDPGQPSMFDARGDL